MKTKLIILAMVLFCFTGFAQVRIPNSTSPTDNSTELKVEKVSSGSPIRGTLFPKLTKAQVYNLLAPATGLIAYDSCDNVFRFFHPTLNWQKINIVPSFATEPAISYEGQFIFQSTVKLPCIRIDSGWKRFDVTGNKLPN